MVNRMESVVSWKRGLLQAAYTTPGLARQLGRCHSPAIDNCSLLLNFIRLLGPKAVHSNLTLALGHPRLLLITMYRDLLP